MPEVCIRKSHSLGIGLGIASLGLCYRRVSTFQGLRKSQVRGGQVRYKVARFRSISTSIRVRRGITLLRNKRRRIPVGIWSRNRNSSILLLSSRPIVSFEPVGPPDSRISPNPSRATKLRLWRTRKDRRRVRIDSGVRRRCRRVDLVLVYVI